MNTVFLLLLSSCGTWSPDPFARALVIEDLSQGIGGPKAIAQPGDFVLENDRIRVAILGGHNSMGPGLYGGSLADADLQRWSGAWTRGNGNDRLAETIPSVNLNVTHAVEAEDVYIVSDGSDGGPAIVRAVARDEPFVSLLGGLWALVGAPRMALSTEYILEPGKPYLRIRTTAFDIARGSSSEAAGTPPDTTVDLHGSDDLPILELAIETGLVFCDFYLQGGDVDVFAPTIGFDEDGAVYRGALAGRNSFEDPFKLDFVAGSAEGVSYALAVADGPLHVPLFTASQTAGCGAGVAGDPDASELFPDGSSFTYERYFAIGDGDIGSAMDAIYEARIDAGVLDASTLGHVSGHVVEEQSHNPLSGLHVFVYPEGETEPYTEWQTDVSFTDTNPDGSFGGRLPAGRYELLVHEEGRPSGNRVGIEVQGGGEVELTLVAPRSGYASFRVQDETGIQVPSKVTIEPAQGEAIRDPILGDGYIAGNQESVLFCPYGECDTQLPPGRYVAYATRGPEYELGVAEFEVSAAHPAEVELMVVRSVDTAGWISADFHVHAQPSHDSGVIPPDRVITMASENVEFMVSSDHDYIIDYRPVIEELGLQPWISSDVGEEVTPVELGHYIAFPLQYDNLDLAGGALDWTGLEPGEILDGLRAMGRDGVDPVTFVAHPRDGILGYFDQFGFDPYVGEIGQPVADAGFLTLTNPLLDSRNFDTDFDALELLNGKRFDILRTPTQPELDQAAAEFAAGDPMDGYPLFERTLQEQQDLEAGIYRLGYGLHGQIDDWFSLLNLGFRYTALGNSDTHDKTGVEAGCPRNYVASPTDDPAYIRTEDIAAAVKAGHVIATTGPFVRFTADDAYSVGDELVSDQPVQFYIEVQSPTWYNVDHVELYRNGELIEEWQIESPNADIVNLAATFEDQPDVDSWYVVIAMGDDALDPLFTPVEYPPVYLQDVVSEALSGVDAVSNLLSALPPHPRQYSVYPYALTNPIYVDIDGDGWDPPGLPSWLEEPEAPAE